MTGDQYLRALLAKITVLTGPYGNGDQMREELRPVIVRWAGTQLSNVTVSGSYAKGTAVVGGTDVDLFISLKQDTVQSLRDIFESLAQHLSGEGFTPRRQNVSIGIAHRGLKVDLVPGKLQNTWSQDHSLWVSRQQTWQKTDVQTHISNAIRSGQTDLIRLMKRWRTVNGVEMPSFVLELATIKALGSSWATTLDGRMRHVLEFLRDHILTTALPDPANASNNVASELSATEKAAIARQATVSIGKPYWEQIVW